MRMNYEELKVLIKDILETHKFKEECISAEEDEERDADLTALAGIIADEVISTEEYEENPSQEKFIDDKDLP